MVKVKICGMRNAQDIAVINEVKPDYIGFILADSKRRVGIETTRTLVSQVKYSKCIGVFVNHPVEEVAKIAHYTHLDGIQLHGEEDHAYIEALRTYTSLPIWKAVRIRKAEDLQNIPDADHLLLDSYSPQVYGGSGKRIAREVLQSIDVSGCILAGGVSIDNVEEFLQWKPYAIDVSSSLETYGYKDEHKIREFMKKVNKIRGIV